MHRHFFGTSPWAIKMKRMRKCEICKSYTLDALHCGAPTNSPHPPKFSIDDKYADYRRMNFQSGN